MSFNGVDIPEAYWRDRERGTSLSSDFARLLSGGLYSLGDIKRREDEKAREQAIRESEFSRTLSQRQLEHQDTVSRWDEDRAAKRKEDAAPYFLNEQTGFYEPQPIDPASLPQTTVPAMRDAGKAALEAFRTSAPEDPQWSAANAEWDRLHPGAPTATAASAVPSRPFLRAADAARANALRQHAQTAQATEDFRVQTDREQADRFAEQKRVQAAKEALVAGNRRLFSEMHPELTPAQTEALANADPVTADRFLGSLERERTAREKAARADTAEAATVATMHSEIQGVAKRAAAEGIDLDIPSYAFNGPNRTPASTMMALARTVEKNYDDALRVKIEAANRDVRGDSAKTVIRARFLQHEADAYTREAATAKRLYDKTSALAESVAGMDPERAAKLAPSVDKARLAYETAAKHAMLYNEALADLVGIDLETGRPAPSRSAPAQEPPAAPNAPNGDFDAIDKAVREEMKGKPEREIRAEVLKRLRGG